MNLPTIIAATVIAVIFVAIIAGQIKRKKQGKGGCSCGCGGCSFKESCHKTEEN